VGALTTITFVLGDITEQAVDAMVNAAGSSLTGGGGVDGAIHAAAGPSLLEECLEIRATTHPDGLKPGEAVTTGAGELPARSVIHALGPHYRETPETPLLLAAAYTNALREADKIGAKTVAFPAISAGVFGYPIEEAAKVAIDAVRNAETDVVEVRFVLFDERAYEAFTAAWEERLNA
jgi:O-acetyl-ADP-ribose deacetylase (regulator of RNase III)